MKSTPAMWLVAVAVTALLVGCNEQPRRWLVDARQQGAQDVTPLSDGVAVVDSSQQDGNAALDGAPADSASIVPFSFFALGDTRSNPSIAQQNFQSMTLLDPGAIAVFNGGDLTTRGEVSQWQAHAAAVNLGSAGKIRMDLTAWSASSIRYVGILGNHDTADANWLANWNQYLPGQKDLGTNGEGGIYFAITYKSAIFIVLDSQHTSDAQTSWLKTTLATANSDSAIKWKFAFYHKPVYPCDYKTPWSPGIPWVREFEKYGVDIAFNGHAHVYERTCAMVGGRCKKGGVIYVISGGGGTGTGAVSPDKTATVGPDSYDCGEILESAKGHWHHYCRIQIEGGKLTYGCYQYDTAADPEDTFTVAK